MLIAETTLLTRRLSTQSWDQFGKITPLEAFRDFPRPRFRRPRVAPPPGSGTPRMRGPTTREEGQQLKDHQGGPPRLASQPSGRSAVASSGSSRLQGRRRLIGRQDGGGGGQNKGRLRNAAARLSARRHGGLSVCENEALKS